MPKRRPIAPWQLEKQRTAKGLRELALCEECRIKRGFGFGVDGLWLCVDCAMIAKFSEQRAQRERT